MVGEGVSVGNSREVWDNHIFQHPATRPGKHTKSYGKIHHFQWVNQLFLWPFSNSYVKLPEGALDLFHVIPW